MIVVDSSAWIEFYRPTGHPAVREAVAAAIGSDQAAVNGIIRVEILSFAPDQRTYHQLVEDFEAFHWLGLGNETFEWAIETGFHLRRKAITVPATDLIIAASAYIEGAVLYHRDKHYDLIAEHTSLNAVYLGRRM